MKKQLTRTYLATLGFLPLRESDTFPTYFKPYDESLLAIFFDSLYGEFFKIEFPNEQALESFKNGTLYLNLSKQDEWVSDSVAILVKKINLLPMINKAMIISTDDFHQILAEFEAWLIDDLESKRPFKVGDRIFSKTYESAGMITAFVGSTIYISCGSRFHLPTTQIDLINLTTRSRLNFLRKCPK